MDAGTALDNRLVRALREGKQVLPADLGQLRAYLRLIAGLLAEKAEEVEADWELACVAAAELDTLQTLEVAVAERAITVRSDTLDEVRSKLEIWRALAAGDEDCDLRDPRNRLILSVEADLERLVRVKRS
jgi:hypothetical protein